MSKAKCFGGGGPSCPPEEDSGFSGGDGTADSPFLICSRSQLETISAELTLHYELGQNIDLQKDPFTPILGPFTGSLDGKGYEIQNLTITVSTKEAGLFAELGAAWQYPKPGYSRPKRHKYKYQRYISEPYSNWGLSGSE